MKNIDEASTRGIIHAAAGQSKFTLSRFEPAPQLRPFVEHYWGIYFDLRGEPPYTQKVLSFPNINLAFEEDDGGRRALVYGIPERPFSRELSGAGRVLGVKFRAGGFYPFWQQEVSRLTGQTIEASEVFGAGIEKWQAALLQAADAASMAEKAELALLERLPARDSQAERTASIVDLAMNDRSITKVEYLSARVGLSIRQLQRLFNKYIGVTPKWVIKRYRLQEAAERLERDETTSLTELALQLGYFDQAHFIKDFKAVIGKAPLAHMKEAE